MLQTLWTVAENTKKLDNAGVCWVTWAPNDVQSFLHIHTALTCIQNIFFSVMLHYQDPPSHLK